MKFMLNQGWNYLDAIYYCFTTLMTTGFGDFVAGLIMKENTWIHL